MSLPTIEKTWQFTVNNTQGALGSSYDTNRHMAWDIKNLLINSGSLYTWTNAAGGAITPSNTWTVYYSYSQLGGVAGTPGDGVDRWLDYQHVNSYNTGQGNGSWIVLRNTAIDASGNFQVLIAVDNINHNASSEGATWTIAISRSAGFTGGNGVNLPTATDQITLANTNNSVQGVVVGVDTTHNVGYALHGMISTDGKVHRIIVSRGNNVSLLLDFEKSSDLAGQWTTAELAIIAARADGADGPSTTGYGLTNAGSNSSGVWGLVNNGFFFASLSGRGYNGGLYATTLGINAFTNDYIIEPVGIMAGRATAWPGRHGVVTDLWWSNAPAGSTFPPGGTRQFAQFGTIMVPWNGSIPVT
jgi:hypothetical protein